ncbi:MFS transporter [Brachybacterium sp. DNPG3]
MSTSLSRRRWSLFSFYLLSGLSVASWVTRTPAIRDLLDASTAQMGIVLFGLSIGSMAGILSSGPLVVRFGGRPVIVAGASSLIAAMPVIAVGAAIGSPLLTMIGLILFGAGIGGAEVAMNVEGAEVERLGGKPFLPLLHGGFSLGTVIGALLGILANAAGFPVVAHLVLIGIAGALLMAWAIPGIPAGTGRVDPALRDQVRTVPAAPLWKDARLLLIGGVVLALALAEGAANDWLPLVMVDGHGFDSTWGSAIFTLFALSMTIGRFAGNVIVTRIGRAPVLCASALSAAAGLALVAFVDSQVVAVAAVVLWGLGAALGFPLSISAAGDSGPDPARRVALASTIGYLAFLVGPPVLGLLGEDFGLRNALILPMVVALIGALLSPATGARRAATADGAASPVGSDGSRGAVGSDGSGEPAGADEHPHDMADEPVDMAEAYGAALAVEIAATGEMPALNEADLAGVDLDAAEADATTPAESPRP